MQWDLSEGCYATCVLEECRKCTIVLATCRNRTCFLLEECKCASAFGTFQIRPSDCVVQGLCLWRLALIGIASPRTFVLSVLCEVDQFRWNFSTTSTRPIALTNLRRGSLATATKILKKMSTALLPQTLATAIPDLGPKRENGEWVSTWERFTDRHLDLFTIYDAFQKRIPSVLITIARRSHK